MKLFLFFLMSFTTAVAQGSFSGIWTGPGHSIDVSGNKSNCKTLSITMEQKKDTLEIVGGLVDCGYGQGGWVPFVMTIKDNELWVLNKKYGTISSSQIHIQYPSKSGNFTENYFFDLTDNRLLYREVWAYADGTSWVIEGYLSKIK